MSINLTEMIKENKFTVCREEKIPLKGRSVTLPAYQIPLEYLKYNVKNGRIATYVSEYIEENGGFNEEDIDKFNSIIQDYIWKDDSEKNIETMKNIDNFGQIRVGVVISDGTVIDGNRRLTCLRKLYEENPIKTNYFEAVVLDIKELNIDEKDIKRLELNLQHGIDEKQDYNPIEKLVDIYNCVKKEKMFSLKEYGSYIQESDSTVNKMYGKALLMAEYLEYIKAPEKFYIAKDLKLDGPVEEIYNYLRNIKEDDLKQEDKYHAFQKLLAMDTGDRSRVMRVFLNDILKSQKAEFVEKNKENSERIQKIINDDKDGGIKIIKAVLATPDVMDNGKEIYNELKYKSDIKKEKNKPLAILNKTLDALNEFDEDLANKLPELEKNELSRKLSQILELAKDYNNGLVAQDD